ncbi:TonB-dependent receptor [Flavobacteriaceae bacterium]|nr:TonB-dependent receptor [Flavobacteriaceae bacterium]
MTRLLTYIIVFIPLGLLAQSNISGRVTDVRNQGLPYATIVLDSGKHGVSTDAEGYFELQTSEKQAVLNIYFMGFESQKIKLKEGFSWTNLNIVMQELPNKMDEVVVSGTLKPVSKLESPVPVEVYSPAFFQKNPTTNVYEALQNVNGVRPQLNCQVCNTGDIHINGLEGPYTMVLIDGMPIVSSLATVYGLSGIPNSLIDRMEIVKGPASTLYGSEAIGGLINIITTNPLTAPKFSIDLMSTTWQEYNIDLGYHAKVSDNIDLLTGINYFNYNNPQDNNLDNFTDLALQERISIFQKINISENINLAARFYNENRWGGEMQWTPEYKGSDEIYGETIETTRWELMGSYSFLDKFMLSLSANSHHQDSAYGDMLYIADQDIVFGQLTYVSGDWLLGTATRYNYYDDNTPATPDADSYFLPGIFAENTHKFNDKNEVLLGLRVDYHKDHKSIFTPRIAYKYKFDEQQVLRLNLGTGFRVVNLFTEDHAALTGAREVIIEEDLKPERSYNANLNYVKRFNFVNGGFISVDASMWFTYFTNLILPDYDSDPNEIIYSNLDGHAQSMGSSIQLDFNNARGLSGQIGATLMDVSTYEDGIKSRQVLTEQFSATWGLSYRFFGNLFSADYTGNLYGPMLLPTLGPFDPRPDISPWWSIQNIQVTYETGNFEIYTGIKNLLNWTPWKNADYPIIARSFDPFDKEVVFDDQGQATSTPNNPYALTFDPSYVYAPNQGRRAFLGLRYKLY